MTPIDTNRAALWFQYSAVALGGAAFLCIVGGLALTTTANGLTAAGIIGLALCICAGLAFGLSLRLSWPKEITQSTDEDHPALR